MQSHMEMARPQATWHGIYACRTNHLPPQTVSVGPMTGRLRPDMTIHVASAWKFGGQGLLGARLLAWLVAHPGGCLMRLGSCPVFGGFGGFEVGDASCRSRGCCRWALRDARPWDEALLDCFFFFFFSLLNSGGCTHLSTQVIGVIITYFYGRRLDILGQG